VFDATAMVIVELPEPGAAIGVGLKLTVTPDGCPVADKATEELNPPETAVVIVEVPLFPRPTVTEAGDPEMVKSGTGAGFTVSVTVVVCIVPPPEPVTVIG
jgi:hypothetical protein